MGGEASKRRRRAWLVVGVLLVSLLLVGGTLGVLISLSQRPVPIGLVDGKLRPCPSSPNCVCSEPETDPKHLVAPFPIEDWSDPTAALRSLEQVLANLPGSVIQTSEDDYVHAVVRTPLLGFADDVELRLDREAKLIHVRSASRIGHSDLGANRKRIELLRERWDREQ